MYRHTMSKALGWVIVSLGFVTAAPERAHAAEGVPAAAAAQGLSAEEWNRLQRREPVVRRESVPRPGTGPLTGALGFVLIDAPPAVAF